jgi:Flp pilus assembly protein TadD
MPALESSSGHLILRVAAIFCFAFIAYLPSLPGAFLMDDWRLIQTDNPLANGRLTPLSIWFQTGFPLSDLGLRLEGIVWGENPLFYHLMSIMLHALSAVIVWRLLARLRIRGAWVAAVLFAVHPICVNSVVRIAELKNTLSLPFFLLSLLCYLHYEASALYPETTPSIRQRRIATAFYLLSLAAFVLALFAKTSTVMLPVILCACAIWRRGRLSFKDLVHTAPHFVLAASFGWMSIWFQKYQALAGQTLPQSSFLERLLVAPRVFGFYLIKALLPLNLSIVYPRWKVDTHSAGAYMPLVTICICAFVCWRFRRSWGRHALFGFTSFGILLFPVLGLFDAQYLTRWQVSDHLVYLPLIAPIALLSAMTAWAPTAGRIVTINLRLAIESLLGFARPQGAPARYKDPLPNRSKAYWLCAGGMIAIFFALAFQRANAFSTEEKLMRDTLSKNPLASDAHNDLGVILVRRNDLAGARSEFDAAVRTDPNNIAAQSNLAFVTALQGGLSEARSRFQAILRAKPFDAETHLRMARLCKTQRQCRRARYHLQMAMRLKPSAETKLQLAQLCYETGHSGEAVAALRELLRMKPDSTEALNNLAWLLATCGDERVRDGTEAVRCAKEACRLTDFKEPVFMSTLAAAYAETGRFPQAISMAEKALRLQMTAGQTELAELNRQLLAQYRSGKAFHQQMTSAESND